ncbi:MAG TPA: class I SAM-dependent methyltransferase [Chloroflexota bacterium]|nr:class I SAM-dependent methyltransferase [Chloroflexota bacterium]
MSGQCGLEKYMPWIVGGTDADSYDAAYETRAAAGQNVHGEADFVERHGPRSVLDAGCGTGRLARELARRGLETVGVDLDPRMLAVARQKAPDLEWQVGDLATVNLGRAFDAVVLAGNVMIFVTPGTEAAVLANLGRHLLPNGMLIAGFQLLPNRLDLDRYDSLAAEAGYTLAERWATWDEEPWLPGGEYAVSVHRKPTS